LRFCRYFAFMPPTPDWSRNPATTLFKKPWNVLRRPLRPREASDGWFFTVIDHAAAASKNALRAEAAHRDCIWQSQPWHQASGRTPTLAIDVSLRALVWQDDQDKVWLTYNSGLYLRSHVYPRHGLDMPAESAEAIDQVLAIFAEEATHSPSRAPGPLITPVKPL
jgi:hypothetical protein